MALFDDLLTRAQSQCELCASTEGLSLFEIPPVSKLTAESALIVCGKCREEIENPGKHGPHHWRCLSESMWSEHRPVKVMTHRLLSQLPEETWARELLEQLYLEEEDLEWSLAGVKEEDTSGSDQPTFDSNGTRLQDGDSVTLIKDLDVKGAGFTAKRGTLVKNISLTSNPKHIEGKVNGIQIVLVAAYLKKA